MVSQKGGFGEGALVPVFGTREHPNVPSFRSGFWYPGTSTKTIVLETTLLRTSDFWWDVPAFLLECPGRTRKSAPGKW